MPRSNWLPYLAAVGIALLLIGHDPNAIAKNDPAHSSPSTRHEKPSAAPQQLQPLIPAAVQSDIHRLADSVEAEARRASSDEEKQRAQTYLQTQIHMAKYASKMFKVGIAEAFITFIGVMLVGATLFYTRRAALAAQTAAAQAGLAKDAAVRQAVAAETAAQQARTSADEANKINRDALEAANRPWITVEIMPLGWGWGSGRVDRPRFIFTSKYTNYGHTPASQVFGLFELWEWPDAAKIAEVQKRLSDILKNRPFGLDRQGFEIRPRRWAAFRAHSVLLNTPYGQASESIKAKPEHQLVTYLIGVVDYKAAYSDRHLQKMFAAPITKKRPPGGAIAIGTGVLQGEGFPNHQSGFEAAEILVEEGLTGNYDA